MSRRLVLLALVTTIAGATCAAGVAYPRPSDPGTSLCPLMLKAAQTDGTGVAHTRWVHACVLPEWDRPTYAPPPAYRRKRGGELALS